VLHQKVEEGLEKQWKWRLIMESDPIFDFSVETKKAFVLKQLILNLEMIKIIVDKHILDYMVLEDQLDV